MDDRELEHPWVSCALRTGYGPGMEAQAPETMEELRAFAMEHMEEYLDFTMADDPDVLERFAEEHPWLWEV